MSWGCGMILWGSLDLVRALLPDVSCEFIEFSLKLLISNVFVTCVSDGAVAVVILAVRPEIGEKLKNKYL